MNCEAAEGSSSPPTGGSGAGQACAVASDHSKGLGLCAAASAFGLLRTLSGQRHVTCAVSRGPVVLLHARLKRVV